MKFSAIAVLGLIGFAPQCFAGSPPALTGQTWIDFPEVVRVAYIAGFADGLTSSGAVAEVALRQASLPATRAKELTTRIGSVFGCLREMTNGQKMAVVDKAIRDHPETWDHLLWRTRVRRTWSGLRIVTRLAWSNGAILLKSRDKTAVDSPPQKAKAVASSLS